MCLVMQECWSGAAAELWWAATAAVLLVGAGLCWSAGALGRRIAARETFPADQPSAFAGFDDSQPFAPSSLQGVLPVDSGPDIHLVMNTFNRLAGECRFEDGATPDPIFVLSDYLRQCLVHTEPAQVALHEEIDMLRSYLRLVATFHGCDLRASVELAPGGGDVRVQAHSICLVAQVLLAELGAESCGRFVLPVRVQGLATGGIDVDMALHLESRPPNMHLRQMRAELKRLGALMSRRSVRWSCRVVSSHRSDIAVSLRIRPRPAL